MLKILRIAQISNTDEVLSDTGPGKLLKMPLSIDVYGKRKQTEL